MSSVDSVGSSLYFSAAAASAVASKEAKKEHEKLRTQGAKKASFSSLVQKNQEIEELESAGLPSEIAGMDQEAAVIFLKDALDIAADKLEENQTAENFTEFRKTVSQFFKYIEKNNFDVTKNKRLRSRIVTKKSVFNTVRRPQDPFFQIRVVNQKLDEMARMILQYHADKIQLLNKVGEIKGLIVDFFAD